VNNLSIFNAPINCEIDNVYMGSKQLVVPNLNYFKIFLDGVYRFDVKDTKSGVIYSDTFVVDNTYPKVSVEPIQGSFEDGITAYPVEIKNDEKDVKIYLRRNGEVVDPNRGALTEAGRYYMSAIDEAGNESDYTFRIVFAYRLPWQAAVLIVIIVCGAVSLEIVRLKKKVEIR
jgi:hypothetical protein